jgi:hypothetical protein
VKLIEFFPSNGVFAPEAGADHEVTRRKEDGSGRCQRDTAAYAIRQRFDFGQ